ncbi:MAG: hypothetical protein EOO88_47320 [Pedobacter sp.]|nr:MAG: hypothetical protein EOO88_47320 [Pedobacter sp.]
MLSSYSSSSRSLIIRTCTHPSISCSGPTSSGVYWTASRSGKLKNFGRQFIQKGLAQRVQALNMFLDDIYHKGQILKEGVIPAEKIYNNAQFQACLAKGGAFLRDCLGILTSLFVVLWLQAQC